MKQTIYQEVKKIKKKYHTSDPFGIMEAMHVEVWDTPPGMKLKGFCFLSNRIFYVSINPDLEPSMRRIVAAHELGHIILHKSNLKMEMMTDYTLNDFQKDTEYDANLFAVELLLDDEDVIKSIQEDGNYFSLCSKLHITPSMMSFKLYSMCGRGYAMHLPLGIDSRCLGR